MRYLTIDVGTINVGWAIGDDSALRHPASISYGTYNPPPNVGRNIGWLLVDIRAWLTTQTRNNGITNIVYCSPVLVYSNNWWTIRKVVSIGGLLEVAAYDLGIQIEEADEPRVRKHFLAPHKVPRKSQEIKDAVMARCRALGWAPSTDDEGDSLAVLDFTLALKNSTLSRKIGALL